MTRREAFVAGDAFHRSRLERLAPSGFWPGEGRDSFESLRLEPRCARRLRLLEHRRPPSLPPARALPEGSARGVPARASPCPRFPFGAARTPEGHTSWRPKPDLPISAVSKDARAHPYELLILLRARLPPLSAFALATRTFVRAKEFVSSVISARTRSHALCNLPCDRSLGRRSREAPLAGATRLTRVDRKRAWRMLEHAGN